MQRTWISNFKFRISDFGFDSGIRVFGFRASKTPSRRDSRWLRFSLSIGHWVKRTQRICFTAMLQTEGLSDVPSVAVKKLDGPALNRSRSRRGPNKPSRGGGVLGTLTPGMPQKNADASAALGGKLKPSGFDPRKFVQRRHHRADSLAAQTFARRPDQVFGIGGFGLQQKEPIQRKPMGGQRRRIKLSSRIAPDNGAGGK